MLGFTYDIDMEAGVLADCGRAESIAPTFLRYMPTKNHKTVVIFEVIVQATKLDDYFG